MLLYAAELLEGAVRLRMTSEVDDANTVSTMLSTAPRSSCRSNALVPMHQGCCMAWVTDSLAAGSGCSSFTSSEHTDGDIGTEVNQLGNTGNLLSRTATAYSLFIHALYRLCKRVVPVRDNINKCDERKQQRQLTSIYRKKTSHLRKGDCPLTGSRG